MADFEKRGYLLENFRLFHLRTQQDSPVDFHYHEFYKLVFLVSGQGNYYIEGNRYLLQSGDIVMVGSRTVHRPELDTQTLYERIILYISPDFLKAYSTSECDLFGIFSSDRGHVLRLQEKQRKTIYDMVLALEKDMSSEGFGKDLLCSTGLLRILIRIGRYFSQHNASLPAPFVTNNQRILEIIKYIDDNISDELDVGMLADRFYISKYHMMRLFHQEVGSTVHTYITVKRLLLARELISSGMRATQACYQCGFHNYSSFTRAYGKYFGTTPTGRIDKGFILKEGYE